MPASPYRALVLALAALLVPLRGSAFVTLSRSAPDNAGRWSAAFHEAAGGAGLEDGLQVAIEPEIAERLAIAVTGMAQPEDVADVEAALLAAFAAWANSVLSFEVELDGPVDRGTNAGAEIDVFLVPEADPVFVDNAFFGVTFVDSVSVADLELTNGQTIATEAFTRADIFLNRDRLQAVAGAFTRAQQPAALQRLLMHEIGHALGLHHPNVFAEANYDTDADPLNVIFVDPGNPNAGLQLSPTIDTNAVMSNLPASFEGLILTAPRNDDLAGRDVLYPPRVSGCAGDCNADLDLTIDELLGNVGIALEQRLLGLCPVADSNRDQHIAVEELVGMTRTVLNGCAPREAP